MALPIRTVVLLLPISSVQSGAGMFKPRTSSTALPSAREVVRVVHFDKSSLSQLTTFLFLSWGQFIDHDITLTAEPTVENPETGEMERIVCGSDGCSDTVPECFPIPLDRTKDDAFENKNCLEFVRSMGVPNLKCTQGPRQQLNLLTHYIDGSNVYSSSKAVSDILREHIVVDGNVILGPRLRSLPQSGGLKPLLPKQTGTCFFLDTCFHAGDVRASDQSVLTAIHTMWMRHHNRLVEELAALNPWMNAETLFQEARRIVGALIQRIHYHEFLPVLLGRKIISEYGLRLKEGGYFQDYDETVDASVLNAFATAAYRIHHSMITSKVHMTRKDGRDYALVDLHQTLFNLKFISDARLFGGPDGVLRGAFSHQSENMDKSFSSEITEKLFKTDDDDGTSLPSLNIQRGRDHGLPAYHEWRKWCNLKQVNSFKTLGMVLKNDTLASVYKELYKNNIYALDLFSVAAAEPAVKGGLVGETFACIIARQFQRLRLGDRFWHEGKNKNTNYFTPGQLKQIRRMTFAKVICRNSDDIDEIQPRPLLLEGKGNKRIKCSRIKDMDLREWKYEESQFNKY